MKQIRLTPLLLSLFFIPSCNHADKKNDAYNVIRLIGTEFKYQMPDTIPAGYNLIRLINIGKIWHEAAIFKFISDTFSIQQYVDSANKGIDFPSCAVDIGGPGMTVANDSNEVILNFTPGKYGIVCTIDHHMMAGMYKEFYVVNKNSTYNIPPKEDNMLILTDTIFTFLKPVTEGEHLIKIINTGHQYHEVDFIKLNAGKTKDDYINWFHNRSNDPSGAPVGGTLDFYPGNAVWLPINLKKGDYYLSCMIPNVATGKAHLDMNVNKEFSIK
jgi:hypothetical protein